MLTLHYCLALNTGATWRHGPHQLAKKSITTRHSPASAVRNFENSSWNINKPNKWVIPISYTQGAWDSGKICILIRFIFIKGEHHNPFTPESDQCQNSPAASQGILHHTVWRTWLFIAYLRLLAGSPLGRRAQSLRAHLACQQAIA